MEASTRATEAINTLSNIRATKKKGVMDKDKQREALWYLKTHLAGRNQPVPAISTGRENEVVISGIGATAKCKGVKGTLKPGDRVMVQIKKVDPERGSLSVVLIE
jgi:predicted RNA-binding protein with TRAM domain